MKAASSEPATWSVLLEPGRDRLELRVQSCTDRVDRRDDHNRMPAAISPYSIAVAPDSSLIKAETFDIDVLPLVIEVHVSARPIKESLSGAATACQVFPDLSVTRLT